MLGWNWQINDNCGYRGQTLKFVEVAQIREFCKYLETFTALMMIVIIQQSQWQHKVQDHIRLGHRTAVSRSTQRCTVREVVMMGVDNNSL